MLKFFRALFESKPKVRIAHSVLGELALQQGANGPYCLREAHHDGELTLCVETIGEAPPTEAQAEFFLKTTDGLESIYQTVAANLALRHKGMELEPVASDWRRSFRLASLDVPLEGDAQLPWDITFECLTNNSGNLHTCHFENGLLAHVSVDT